MIYVYVLVHSSIELNEKDKCRMRGFVEHLIDFPNGFNKFRNTETRMQNDTKIALIYTRKKNAYSTVCKTITN